MSRIAISSREDISIRSIERRNEQVEIPSSNGKRRHLVNNERFSVHIVSTVDAIINAIVDRNAQRAVSVT